VTRSPFLAASDVTLHHVSAGPLVAEGAGEPLVFLHSLGCDLRLWEHVATGFVARHRVVRCDLRGHGRSPAGTPEPSIDDQVADLIALLDHLGLRSVSLIGISVGGLIALAAALRHRQRVRRLVISASAARIGTRESWAERMALVRSRGLEAMADALVARWVMPQFAAREAAIVAELRSGLVRTPADGYLAMCATLRDTDLRAEAEGLRVPALVLSGEHDPAVPPALGRELADVLPDADWRMIRGCGHLPPVEQPAAVITAIAPFLSEPK
jgi:3-oxoadipate enol-lactonase